MAFRHVRQLTMVEQIRRELARAKAADARDALKAWWKSGEFLRDVSCATGLSMGVLEYAFAKPARNWRFDAAWPEQKVALEIDGGTWARAGGTKCPVCGITPTGGHSMGEHSADDRLKRRTAAALGWRVLAVTWADVRPRGGHSSLALEIAVAALTGDMDTALRHASEQKRRAPKRTTPRRKPSAPKVVAESAHRAGS